MACALLALLVACAKGSAPPASGAQPPSARPSSTARLAVVTPANGSAVPSGNFTLRVSLTGAKIVSATTRSLKANEGHLHVLVDGRLISMTGNTEQPITGLAKGAHQIRVEFVAGDHAPFDPRVVATTTFEVKA